MMRRFSSITLTAMVRCEVASGGRGAVDLRARLFEYVLPALIDGGTVTQVLLIQLVFKPAIDAHFRFGVRCHLGGNTFFFNDTAWHKAPPCASERSSDALARTFAANPGLT